MMKILTWIETNALKIVFTALIILGIFLSGLVIYRIQNEINNLELAFSKAQKDNSIVKRTKPTYDELKSHTVFIIGCAGKKLDDSTKIEYLLGEEEDFCWSGTGSVVKITDTETYIITNNHVSGEDEPNVSLYVQDGNKKLIATVVKHHPYVDMAVIKLQGKLEGKTAITKIASINMQDQIYIVGNPLHNKMIYTEGVMAGYTDTSLLIQAPCIFGSSGSGIYNTNGELVGLVYALQMYPGFMGIPMAQITHTVAVDSVHIKGFLTDLGLYND